MKYAYYPGCSLHGTAKEYDISTRAVCGELGIELQEISDWNCCGASSAHVTNHLLAMALPARNLALAEKMGLDVAAPCAACFNRLINAASAIGGNDVLRARVSRAIGAQLKGDVRVKSLADVIVVDYGLERVASLVKVPLSGLKAAVYYGCLLVRPPQVTGFDDPENPVKIDRLVEALGGEAVDWHYKTECCGMTLSVTRPDVAGKLVNDILAAAKASGAECIVTACPMCQGNLDMRQPEAERQYGAHYGLPVYYFTELMGIAFGLKPGRLGLGTHVVEAMGLLRRKKLA